MKVIFRIKTLLHAFACFTFLIILSCRDREDAPSRARVLTYTLPFQKICKADTTQSYVVYLPSGYPGEKKWPVIFVFDPGANAKHAVEYFKKAAESYGYVLVGSNNSRNGLQTLDHTLDVLVNDALPEFSIDINRQYAAGFSGGGRVASYLAMKTGNIKGVITCGAGMPGFNPRGAGNKFDIYAIAGYEDFNYNEITSLSRQLDKTGWRYVTSGFDGGHAWPPADLLANAACWFRFNAMKDGLIPKDRQQLDQALDSTLFHCNRYLDSNRYIMAYNECKRGIVYLEELKNTKKLRKKLEEIEQSGEFREEKRKEERLQYKEQQLRQGYLASFASRDLTWWKNEIKMLNTMVSTEKDMATRQMFSRVKGFLGIACYSYTSAAINENKNMLAQKYIDIYEVVEPGNPDCFFYKAMLLYRTKKPGEAAYELEKAIELGYNDMDKIKASFPEKVLDGILH